jgi:hypothetical protein
MPVLHYVKEDPFRENLFQEGKQWTAIARLAGAPSAFGLKTAGQ